MTKRLVMVTKGLVIVTRRPVTVTRRPSAAAEGSVTVTRRFPMVTRRPAAGSKAVALEGAGLARATIAFVDDASEPRRRRRAGYEVRVYRANALQQMDEDAALDGVRIPVDERAAYVWQLSQEVYALAHPHASPQPRFPRSLVRVFRS
jgi:hypothetical protein